MKTKRKQQGMTVIGWLMTASIFVFIAVTAVKIVPLYLKFNTVKDIIETIAQDPKSQKMRKQAIYATVDKHINVSSIYDLSSKQFTVEKVRTSKKARSLSVSYEDKVHWFANLDITAKFEHSAVLGEQPEG